MSTTASYVAINVSALAGSPAARWSAAYGKIARPLSLADIPAASGPTARR